MAPESLSVGKYYKKGCLVYEYAGKKYYPESENKNPRATPVYYFYIKEEPVRSRVGKFSLTLCEILNLEEI